MNGPPDSPPSSTRKKILLVDDSRTMLLMHRMMLSAQPYDLVTAADGQEGLEKALAERPALIVMDVMMPRMDGIEACRRLRGEDATRATPIVMVTTRGEEENIRRAFESGCTDFVTKPIDGVEFLTKVRAYTQQETP